MNRSLSAWSPLLYPITLLMRAAVSARNGLYSSGALRQHRLACPVISIGNLSMGGEGKTPLVIYLAGLLRECGVTGGLLSRGYGRIHSERCHIVAPGNDIPSPWKNMGDEPAVIRRYAPELWAGISNDRYAAGCEILKRKTGVVLILDDGFQHRRIHRDLDLVVIDCSRDLPRNRLFPQGTLREPVTSLGRAHAVMLNMGPDQQMGDRVEQLVHRVHPGVPIFHCRQEIDATIPLEAWRKEKRGGNCAPGCSSVFLVAAIGNPERFRRDVESLGMRVAGGRFFRDHRPISTREWFECADAARRGAAEAIMTTEKDAVKLAHVPDFPILVASQATRMLEGKEFKTLVLNAIGASIEAH